MIKYLPIFSKTKTFIYECEVSLVRPKPSGLKSKEESYKVNSPSALNGELFCDFNCMDSLEDAYNLVRKYLSQSFTKQDSKLIIFSEQEIEAHIQMIEYVPLKAS